MYAEIDYGYGTAQIWGDFDASSVERFFMQHANQCFGIRKSIAKVEMTLIGEKPLPMPWADLRDASTVLKHSGGDTIVWNSKGEKIKSEWD
ncbi:hypothetical protein [Novosphingobium sp. KN65.2]|uniref:hypothetical protein n=1 Tax=Novosphingobium sp. KN65.2 TaxID=1478134 RepID=UPI0005DEB16D|nr:hypothetical protein [Novosphingobium sp. KN65.2]CDO37628.1 hypothetical protein SPHV1_370015 [Novosphingobium sp. KN65.2]